MLRVVVDQQARQEAQEKALRVRKYLRELDAAVADTKHMELLKPMVSLNQSLDQLLELVTA